MRILEPAIVAEHAGNLAEAFAAVFRGGQAIFLICAETVLLASLVLGLLMFGTAR